MVNRRIGKESSETRQLLLSAAEQLMREEGYAEVTSRKLARRAGLKPQLVHYYFRTMDELFEALFRRVTEKYLAAMKEIAEQDDALVRMFELSCDTSSAALHLEFLALAIIAKPSTL
jgi:TetR/AcrR family transcriptional regulator